MTDIFSPDALKEELDKLPKNEVRAGVEASNGDVGAGAEISKDFGKASIEAEASWMVKAGYRVAAFFGYKW